MYIFCVNTDISHIILLAIPFRQYIGDLWFKFYLPTKEKTLSTQYSIQNVTQCIQKKNKGLYIKASDAIVFTLYQECFKGLFLNSV